MTPRRRALLITAGVVIGLLTAPLWWFELLVAYGLRGEVLPERWPPSGAPALMQAALWIASGEEPDSGVAALWAGNFFRNPRAPSSPGRFAATSIAEVLIQPPGRARLRHGERHLRTAAVVVWLTRRADEAHLKLLLAEVSHFGRGARGAERAAFAYFGRPVTELTIGQTALLAGLPRAPDRFDPICASDRARRRRAFILRGLRGAGVIPEHQLQLANDEPLGVRHRGLGCADR